MVLQKLNSHTLKHEPMLIFLTCTKPSPIVPNSSTQAYSSLYLLSDSQPYLTELITVDSTVSILPFLKWVFPNFSLLMLCKRHTVEEIAMFLDCYTGSSQSKEHNSAPMMRMSIDTSCEALMGVCI